MAFFKTFCNASLPFGLFMGIVFGVSGDWKFGVIGGLVSGFIFGIFIAAFVAYQSSRFTKNRPLLANETLIKEGGANHYVGMEAVGGWVYLTDKRFYFKSHETNLQPHELPIPLDEITKAEKANTFGIIPNQLRLTLQNGKVEEFVVNGAKVWVEEINKLKNA